MNLMFVFASILVYAFDQPKVVSMGDLKLEKREESLIYQVFNFIIHHRWIFAACLFSVITGVVIWLIVKRQKEIEDISIPGEEIYLEGRKLCLPKSQMLNFAKGPGDHYKWHPDQEAKKFPCF